MDVSEDSRAYKVRILTLAYFNAWAMAMMLALEVICIVHFW